MTIRILTVAIENELDVVAARQRAREIAGICGFALQDQARIATAISELARNIYNYASKGKIEFTIEGGTSPQLLVMKVQDEGPGIPHIETVLSGNYQSSTGMGLGVIGAKRLMDRFEIETSSTGTSITIHKLFPMGAPVVSSATIGALLSNLNQLPPNITLSEVQHQNRELLRTLDELSARQKELLLLTKELEDTNRGVVALYAELDEKANHLRRADELKTRFLSNMSHEFRTPLSSIRALSKLLLDRVDGDLNEEQEIQVNYILEGAASLAELVNDLLDLAKIEAGKTEILPIHFTADETFSTLKGMLKPLLVSDKVLLNFQELKTPFELYQDESKISQILRNFISNALKFTERGEITVRAEHLTESDLVIFSVKDTGVGISESDIELIFEEFSQVQNHLQKSLKGTGLGLPLCKNLATLLGGNVSVVSEMGVGSTFSLTLPRLFNVPETVVEPEHEVLADSRIPVLVIEDEAYERLIYDKYLAGSPFKMIPAASLRDAETQWSRLPPAAVILDIRLKGEDSWRWLSDIKNDPDRSHVPVIVISSVEDVRKGLALGADAYYVKPVLKMQMLAELKKLLNIPEDTTLDFIETTEVYNLSLANLPGSSSAPNN